MLETDRHESTIAAHQEQDIAEPRAISGLALVALALGVASALALTAPYMWALPIAGTAVAVAAVVSIARDPQGKIGRGAAVAGLVLSLLFGVWGVSNHLARHGLLYRQSEVFAQRWLRLVLEGDLYAAHQLKMSQSQRQPPDTDLAGHYDRDSDARIEFRDFSKRPPVPELTALGSEAVCRLVSNRRLSSERGFQGPLDRIVQHFEIEGSRDGLQRELVEIVMTRTLDPQTGEAQWRVENVEWVNRRNR